MVFYSRYHTIDEHTPKGKAQHTLLHAKQVIDTLQPLLTTHRVVNALSIIQLAITLTTNYLMVLVIVS